MPRKEPLEDMPLATGISRTIDRPKSLSRNRIVKKMAGVAIAVAAVLPAYQHTAATINYYQEATQDALNTVDYVHQYIDALGYGTYYFETDQHCSLSDACLTKEIVNKLQPDAVLFGGDATNSGWWIENFCITAKLKGMDESIEKFAVLGNHDTERTAEQYRKYGANVLEAGSIATMKNGATIYGATDPTLTQLGYTNTRLRDPSIARGTFADIVAQDIEREVPDMVLIHNADYAHKAKPPFIISGHYHNGDIIRSEQTTIFRGDDVAAKATGKQAVWSSHVGKSARYIFVYQKDTPGTIDGVMKITIENIDGVPHVQHTPISYFGEYSSPDLRIP